MANRNSYKSWIERSPDNALLRRASCRWNDDIRMHLIKTTRERITWLQVVQINRYWWDFINMIFIVCLHKRGDFLDHLWKRKITKGEAVTWSWVRTFPLIPFGSITNLIICTFHKHSACSASRHALCSALNCFRICLYAL